MEVYVKFALFRVQADCIAIFQMGRLYANAEFYTAFSCGEDSEVLLPLIIDPLTCGKEISVGHPSSQETRDGLRNTQILYALSMQLIGKTSWLTDAHK